MQDPSEGIENTAANFMSIGAGVAWFHQPSDDFYIKLGLSGRNLNEPDITYLELDDAKIARKFSGYARAEYRAWPSVALMPLVAGMVQNNYRELMVGGDVKWYITESAGTVFNMSGGLHYRWRDAALVEFTIEYNAFLFALTYDANLSKLTPASKSVGSFELGMVYRLVHNRRVRHKAMPCPII